MIPKIIHYCWFGGNPLTPLAKKCIAGWKKYCPDYEIIEWNETNFDITSNQYVNEAYQQKKYAFVSDYVRLFVLYTNGGIYMDTDVEVCKPLDFFLKFPAFSGFESYNKIPTGILGAEQKNKWIESLLSDYEDRHFVLDNGQLDLSTNVEAITNITASLYNICLNNTEQHFDDFSIFPFDWLCAKDWSDGKIKRTANTYSIHHFAGSWETPKTKVKNSIYRTVSKIIGKEAAKKQLKLLKKIGGSKDGK